MKFDSLVGFINFSQWGDKSGISSIDEQKEGKHAMLSDASHQR